RVARSAVAARGGAPRATVVAVEAPPRLPIAILDGLMRGLAIDARRHDVDVVGGNLAAAPRLAITVTLAAEAGLRLATRDAARAGDDVWGAGTPGGGAGGAARLL